MYEQPTYTQRPAAPKIKGLVMLSLIALAAAAFLGIVCGLVSTPDVSDDIQLQLGFSYFKSHIQWLLCGLLLPVSLALLSTSTERKRLSKLFMIVAIVFLGMQLFSAFMLLVCRVINIQYSNFTSLLSSIAGSQLLSMMWNSLEGLTRLGSVRGILAWFGTSISIVSNLLYIATNALCMLGFIKLSKAE